MSNILVDSLLSKIHNLYNPFCIKHSKVKIIVEGTGEGQGLKVTKKLIVPLKSDIVSFEFSDDVSKFFRPGLPYTVKVCCIKSKNY